MMLDELDDGEEIIKEERAGSDDDDINYLTESRDTYRNRINQPLP